MTTYRRATRETQITLSLALGGATAESARVQTGEPFLDHMLITLARYAGLRLEITATGDLRHHLIEDVAITLGLALKDAIPEACGRYGHTVLPMDDALVEAAVDVGGRSYYAGRLPSSLYEHFLRSLAENAGITLHVRVLRGRDRHHVVEAAFKATALALRQAMDATQDVFSTKGVVKIEREGHA
jgi:imidazoleglycerol-phosphate dehydratase